jgi:hypothetical protein
LDSLLQDTIPLLEELDIEVKDEAWADTAAHALAAIVVDLEQAAAASRQ